MKVKLTREVLIGNESKAAGDVVDLEPKMAEQFVKSGAGERVDGSEAEPEAEPAAPAPIEHAEAPGHKHADKGTAPRHKA